MFCIYKTVTVAAPVVPSPLAAVNVAVTVWSDVPMSVPSVPIVPLVVAKAFTLVAGRYSSVSPEFPTWTVAVPPSLLTVVTFNILIFVSYPFVCGNIEGASSIKNIIIKNNFISAK